MSLARIGEGVIAGHSQEESQSSIRQVDQQTQPAENTRLERMWNVPSPVNHFTGREEYIEDLARGFNLVSDIRDRGDRSPVSPVNSISSRSQMQQASRPEIRVAAAVHHSDDDNHNNHQPSPE